MGHPFNSGCSFSLGEHIMRNSTVLSAILGAIGGFISAYVGGWSAGMTTLVLFMAIDYFSGLIVAGGFQKQ
jgi:Holin family.